MHSEIKIDVFGTHRFDMKITNATTIPIDQCEIDIEHFYGFGVPSPTIVKLTKAIIEEPRPVRYECKMFEHREDGSVREMFAAECGVDGLGVIDHA